MKNWNFKAIGTACTVVLVVVIARLGVSLGRLIYTIQTGDNIMGGDVMPSWQELVFGDAFFYIGILALVGCIISAIMGRRK